MERFNTSGHLEKSGRNRRRPPKWKKDVDAQKQNPEVVGERDDSVPDEVLKEEFEYAEKLQKLKEALSEYVHVELEHDDEGAFFVLMDDAEEVEITIDSAEKMLGELKADSSKDVAGEVPYEKRKKTSLELGEADAHYKEGLKEHMEEWGAQAMNPYKVAPGNKLYHDELARIKKNIENHKRNTSTPDAQHQSIDTKSIPVQKDGVDAVLAPKDADARVEKDDAQSDADIKAQNAADLASARDTILRSVARRKQQSGGGSSPRGGGRNGGNNSGNGKGGGNNGGGFSGDAPGGGDGGAKGNGFEETNRIAVLKAEIEMLNKAVQESAVTEVMEKLGEKPTFVKGNRDAYVEDAVRSREEEIHQLEKRIREKELEQEIVVQKKKIDALKAEIAELNEAVQKGGIVDLMEKYGAKPTYNHADQHAFVEQAVLSREDEIRRLEEEISGGRKKEEVDAGSAIEVDPSDPDARKFPVPSAGSALDALKAVQTQEGAPDTKAQREVPFDTRFETEFSISAEDLKCIEGFAELSSGQQKLIYENFVQMTLGSVQEEAERLCQEKRGAKEYAEATTSLGKVLRGAMDGFKHALTGTYTKIATEKEVALRMRSGGIEEHRALLEQLVGSIATYGPRVHENTEGELVVDLVNLRERARSKDVRDAEWFAMTELNQVAHAFAKTPASWGMETLGVDDERTERSKAGTFFREKILRQKGEKDIREQKGVYDERKAQYEKAKGVLEEVLRQGGKNDHEIAEALIGIDSRVHQLQTLQTDPEALKALERVADRNVFMETAKRMLNSDGVAYFALGFVGRTVAGAGLGYLGAPLVSSGMAYLSSWDRSAAELRERDRNARKGVGDDAEGALNIVPAESLIAKTEHLLARYENAEEGERPKILSMLRARAEYIHDKQMLGRVNYGERAHAVTTQTRLSEVLGLALATVTAEGAHINDVSEARFEKTEARLSAQLEKTEANIHEARMQYRKEHRVRGVEKAAAFSLAGALTADLLRTPGMWDSAVDKTVDAVPDATDAVVPPAPLKGAEKVIEEMAEETLNAAEVPDVPVEEVPTISESVSDIIAEVGATEKLGTYTIEKGDTLIDIMKENLPDIQKLAEPHAKDNAIANILKSLSPEELDRVGIRSGNVDLIYAGENLNLGELQQIVSEKHEFIERAANRFGGYVEVAQAPKEVSIDELRVSEEVLTRQSTSSSLEVPTGESPSVPTNEVLGSPSQATESLEVPSESPESPSSPDMTKEGLGIEDTEVTEEAVKNSTEFVSPYGNETAEVVAFREKETEAFLNYVSRLNPDRTSAMSLRAFVSSLRSNLDAFVLSMHKEVPFYTEGASAGEVSANISSDEYKKAVRYLAEHITDSQKEDPEIKELMRVMKRMAPGYENPSTEVTGEVGSRVLKASQRMLESKERVENW
jgi:hypothetical protein